MKKNNKSTFIMLLFFFIGLAILFYPSLSNYVNQKALVHDINDYQDIIDSIEKEDYTSYFDKAYEYNEKLAKLANPLIDYKRLGNTEKILNVNGKGMMGYITIDKIKVELPIYQGTSAKVLEFATGLLEGTSFPVGGNTTHAVLSAHRGLPTSRLFTDLDKMEVGDTFVLTILDQTLTYEIDQIRIVTPQDLDDLKIEQDSDYVTLMTCTPYGINTHRMLVRGHRVENARIKKFFSTEGFKISKLMVTPIVCMPILLIWLISIAFSPVEREINFKKKYVYPTKYKQEEEKRKKERLKKMEQYKKAQQEKRNKKRK